MAEDNTYKYVPYYTKNPQQASSRLTNDMIAFKNASGGMEAVNLTLRSLGMRNSELYQTTFKITAAIKLFVGITGIMRSLTMLLKWKEKREKAQAAAMTAAKVAQGPTGWAAIAIAAAVSGTFAFTMAFILREATKPSVDISNKLQRDIAGNQLREELQE